MAEEYKVGEAPWEQPQQEEFAVGQAPWEQPEVINEMTPYVSTKDRLLYKNFGADPGASFNWLQKKYPDVEFKKDADGNVLAKKPQDISWKHLDPQATWYDPRTYGGVKEFARDVGDIAYDIPAGVVTGGAAALGGLAGLTTGPGALATAAGAGALASGGMEATRQGIGSLVGMEGNFSPTQLGVATATGAAAPVLLGTGATAAQIASRAAAKGIEAEAAQQASKGLLQKAVGKVAPKIAGAFSGVKAQDIKTYAKHAPEVDDLIENGITDYATKIHGELHQAVDVKRKAVGEALGERIKAAGGSTHPDEVFAPLMDKVDELSSSRLAGTRDGRAEIKALVGEIKAARNKLPPDLTPDELFTLQKKYKDLAQFGADIRGLPLEQQTKIKAYRDLYGNINSILEEQADTAGLKSEYKKLIDLDGKVEKYFSTPEQTYKSLSGIEAPSKDFARKTAKDLKELTAGQLDIREKAKIVQAYNAFRDPSIVPISSGGVTSTTRTLTTGAAGEAAANAVVPGAGVVGRFLGMSTLGPAAVKVGAKGVYNLNQAIPRYTPALLQEAAQYAPATGNIVVPKVITNRTER